jgi:hypothetical protein
MPTRRCSVLTFALAGLGGCCFSLPTAPPPPVQQPVPVPVPVPTPVQPVMQPIAPGTQIALAPGFRPDPTLMQGMAGGPVNAEALNAECRGYIASAPNHVLEVTAPFAVLRIAAKSDTDITLVVQKSDGTFACEDDSEGLNPAVTTALPAGSHRVWVGTYTSGSGAPYSLGISESPTLMPSALTAAGASPAAPIQPQAIPTACGQQVPNYGAITVGTPLTLGVHTPYTGPNGRGQNLTDDANWSAEMQPFVGQATRVLELAGLDEAGCSGIRVEADQGRYFWRLRDAHL